MKNQLLGTAGTLTSAATKKKTARQLDTEIAEALARRKPNSAR